MSYILDALKKSEAERNQNDGMSLLNYPDQKQIAGIPVWLIVIVTVVVNISALVIWTYWPNSQQDLNAPLVRSETEITRGVAKQTDPTTSEDADYESAPVEVPAQTPVNTSLNEKETASTEQMVNTLANQNYPTTVLPFAALDKAERDAFPQIEFSTHVYSEDPQFRVLIGNGLRLTEGQMLSDTVKLITISENGAVFLYSNRLVEIPVLQDWRIK